MLRHVWAETVYQLDICPSKKEAWKFTDTETFWADSNFIILFFNTYNS